MNKQAQLIDGRKLADDVLLELRHNIVNLRRPPGLAVILVGNDPASKLYVNNKKKASLKIGIQFNEYLCGGDFYPNITEKEIIEMIEFLNNDQAVDGIIVQLPLPKKFNTQKIIDTIDPKKDVDGFHPQNKKAYLNQKYIITSPLISAILHILKFVNLPLNNKKTIIISKNPIFSDPLKQALETNELKVNIVKPEENFEKELSKADLVISVVGKKHYIKKDMIKKDAIVIDVGTTLDKSGNWAGDVDPDVSEVAAFLTPVPGGVGPLTVAMLLQNTYQLAKHNQNL